MSARLTPSEVVAHCRKQHAEALEMGRGLRVAARWRLAWIHWREKEQGAPVVDVGARERLLEEVVR